MKTSQVLLLLLIGTAVQKGTAVTPTFLQTTTSIGTTLPIDISTSPETKESTGIKSETTTSPSTTSTTTVPTTTTTATITSSIVQCQNGGVFDGIKCICQENFIGIFCELDLTEPCKHIPNHLKNFYTPVWTSGVASCVSHCDLMSPNYFNCKQGTCDILPSTGPRCFCPETDLYIYADDRCNGKISKLGLFIGVGVTLAVLVGVTITLAIYLYKKKHQTAQRKEAFYESIE